MACYYLVISSTHLSKGHFRSIKGVFRGPLCRSAGGESPDYAVKERAIAKALEDLKANFYCELCDKQYQKHQEFDNHINSYDHAHKQRLKELKQREFSRNVASKTWKDERKQERALKRLHQLARLKQQSESPVKRAKSRSTTVRGRDRQHQARVQPQVKSRPEHASTHSSPGVLPSTPGSVWSKDLPSIGSPSSLIPPKQPSICPQGSSPSPETLASSRNSRAGVSFCFSKRAQLKLDSCASVFSDGQDETSDCEDLHRQRQKLALWSRSPSPSSGHDNLHPIPAQTAAPMTDGDATLQREADTEDRRQGGGLEAKATFPGTAEADKLGSPLIHSADRQPVGIEDRLRDQQQKPSVEEASRGLEEGEYLDVLSPTVYTDGQGGRDQSQLQRPEDMQIHIHGGSRQDGGLDSEDCLSETEHRGQEMKTWCRETNGESHASFFNVLGKDGVTMLRWPCELLQYTSDEPRISYSCNPLYFNFKVTEGKERSTKDELTDVKNTDRQSDLSARAQAQPQDLPGDKLRILKPKIPKNKKVGKHGAWGRKLDAVKRFREDCALNVCSQSEVGDCFEFRADQTGALPNKRGRTNKRHKPGKRSGSLKDESSNETDMPEHSLKSIVVNLFSKPLPKRKRRQTVRKFVSALRLVRRQPSPDFPRCTTPRENHCQWHHDYHGSRIDASRTPTSEKSWSGWSDLTSDGEGAAVRWEGFSAVPEANYRSPWRNESSHLRSYISTPSSNLSCYGYRYKECSPNIDGEYGSEDHWDYRHAHIYRKRTFSAVCDNTPFVERNRRCSTRRHNRSFEKYKYKDYRGPSISRDLCSYRVFEGPDLQNLDKNLSSSRIRPHRRRGRERLGVLRPNFKERSKAKTCKRPRSRSRCSPSSSSSTSISELSGDWSCHPLQSSHFEPSIVKDAPNSEYTQTLSQLIHCTSVRHTDRPNIPSASCNEEGKDQLSISPPVISTDTNCGILDAMERKSGSPLNSNSSVLQMKSNLKDKNLTLKRASTFPSFPLIGKLPAMRKGMRKGRNPPKKSSGCQDLVAVSADALPALQSVDSVPADTAGHVSSENPKQTKEERQSPSQTLATVVPLNEEVTTTPCAIASILTGENISLSLNNHASCQEDRGSPNSRPLRCSTPPLAEKPITFSEDEIDKYRLLQLQAQQHMQQLHQEEEDEGMEEPQTQLGAAHLDSFPLPAEQTSNQHVPPPCLQYTILQHRALSALSTFSSPTSASPCPRSSLLPHISSSLLIPPLPPSLHQTPFIPFPFSATFLPAHPAPILATHPLHLIPSPSLQPPPPTQPHGLTLHPLCPASLLPAVLTPTPMAAAAAAVAAAASTLRIRPLQHPLYHSADLQHQPRPAS